MSNNIYDILKKFNNLDSVKNMLSEGKKVCKDCGKAKCQCIDESKGSKPDFLDMDKDGDKKEPMKSAAKDKGAIAEAVARVEQQLAEKYQGFKKTVSESEVEESGLQAYLGKKKYGEQGMKALQKAGRDGASKEKMANIRAKHDKMDEGEYNEDMLSPGQKKFAALAEPKDKITYADKIAGAKKKQKDEGNAFSGAVAKAKATGQDEFKVGDKEYKVQEGDYELDPKLKSPESDFFHSRKMPAPVAAWDNDVKGQQKYKDRTSPGIINKAKDFVGLDKPNPEYGPRDTKVKEGFPTVSDAQKRHKEQTGKTTHGTKTKTATGTRHERNYDHDDAGVDRATGEKRGRGRPKADRFA
jgi:hypothetical protein